MLEWPQSWSGVLIQQLHPENWIFGRNVGIQPNLEKRITSFLDPQRQIGSNGHVAIHPWAKWSDPNVTTPAGPLIWQDISQIPGFGGKMSDSGAILR